MELKKMLFTFGATSTILIVFLINQKITIFSITDKYYFNNIASYVAYIVVALLTTYLSLIISTKNQGKEAIKNITKVEQLGESALFSFLQFLIIGVFVESALELITLYLVIFCITYKAKPMQMNPFLLFFGYKYYKIETKNKATLFFIARNMHKLPDQIKTKAIKLDNYTFIEKR